MKRLSDIYFKAMAVFAVAMAVVVLTTIFLHAWSVAASAPDAVTAGATMTLVVGSSALAVTGLMAIHRLWEARFAAEAPPARVEIDFMVRWLPGSGEGRPAIKRHR